MKMTRKLIPAFVMLIVSAIMLSTASYAWFANSTSVTASGMTVKANTDVKFLQISNELDGTYGSSASPHPESGNASNEELDLVTAEVNSTNVVWKTGNSSDPANYDSNATLRVVDPKAQGANYALINTFYVKMSNENSTLIDLDLTGVTVDNDASTLNNALRVLVIAKNDEDAVQGVQVWDNRTEALTSTSTDSLVAEISDGEIYTLEVYIYFDGTDADAYTNNVVAAGAVVAQTVTVSFGEGATQ